MRNSEVADGETGLWFKFLHQQLGATIPGPLLKSGLRPLARYGTCQETVSGRPEQMYTSSDTRLKWPGERPLLKLDSDERRGPKWGYCSSQLLGYY